MATNAAMKPSTGKDMKSVIAQLENASKGVGPKPPPPQGAKPPIVALKGYHPGLKPTRTEKQDNGESPASQTEDGAKPFKVALKPVAQRQTSEISSGKPPVKFEKPVKANNEEPSEPPSRSSLVSNKTKMFETSQKQPEVGTSGDQTPQTPSSGSSVSSKSKMFETTQKPSEGGTANNQAPQTSSSGSSVSSKSKMFETSQKPSEEPVPCEQLVASLCDLKQNYTQWGGKRPFGVSILYMGWDKHYGYQLYQSDPSGNYGGWKATCIGNNSSAAVSMLKQEYKEGETNLKQALDLSIKVLSKTLDTNKLTADKMEIATLTRENEQTRIRILPAAEVEALVKKFEAEEAKAEAEKKKEKPSS